MKRISLTVLLIFFAFCIIYNANYLSEFPKYTHAWAQSDRYALSLGFIDNDFDFFHPQTYVLNHQFPGNYKVPGKNSITSVDFPIHEYFIAGLMRLFNSQNPFVFRLYILIYSLAGLFFLFKSTYILTANYFKSSFVMLFAASSPVFMYYQSGFLPTIPSLSNAIIGLYFFIKYSKSNNIKSFYWAILFFTIASLSRTPFAIYLIALLCLVLYSSLFKMRIVWKECFALIVSFLIITGYYFYNARLRNNYGSMFLAHIMIPGSWHEVIDIIDVIREKWIYQYFTRVHYIYIIISLIISTFVIRRLRYSISGLWKHLSLFLGIILIGNVSYSFLMFKQFRAHDYYFLDTFYLPLLLLIMLTLSIFPPLKLKFEKIGYITFIVALTLPLFILAMNIQDEKRITGSWDRVYLTIENFSNSKTLLESLNIDSEAKILVLDAYAPNIPFILMDRHGFAIMTTSDENISESLNWDYDYIVFQNEFFLSDIYLNYPEIINKIEIIGSNDRITVCKRIIKKEDVSLIDFLGLNDKQPVLYEKVTFDISPDIYWRNILAEKEDSSGGNYAGLLNKDTEYGIMYTHQNLALLNDTGRLLLIKGKLKTHSERLNEFYAVVSIKSDSTNYYNSYNLTPYYKLSNEWNDFILSFQLPPVISVQFDFSVYFWNKGKNDLLYDDIELIIY